MIGSIITGLLYASYLFLICLGLNIIFGVLKILNLFHGSLYELGAYMAVTLVLIISREGFPKILMYPSLIIAGLLVGLFGIFIERTVISRLYKRELEAQLLLTFALTLTFLDIVKMIWGLSGYIVREPMTFLGSVNIGDYIYPQYFFLLIFLSLFIGLITWIIFFKTRFGKLVGACVFDKDMASAMGLNPSKIYTLVFFIGAALAGISGALMVPVIMTYPGVGGEAQTLAFVIMVIGGLKSIKGSLIGSLIVGLIRAIGIAIFPEIELPLVFLIMILVLLIRPTGLFGEA